MADEDDDHDIVQRLAAIDRQQEQFDVLLDKRIQRQVGLLGRVVGASPHATNNIGLLAIILSVAMLLVLAYVPVGAEVPLKELMTLFGSIITLSLGYVFGRRDGSG